MCNKKILFIVGVLLMLFSVAVDACSQDSIRKIFWAEDGNGIYTMSGSELRFLQVPTMELGESLKFSEPEIRFVDYSPKTGVAVLTENLNKIMLYSFNDKHEKRAFYSKEPVSTVEISKDGEKLLVVHENQISASIFNASSGMEEKLMDGFSTGAPIFCAQMSPDGKNILWHSRNTFQLQNIESGVFYPKIELDDFAPVFVLSADADILAVASHDYVTNFANVLFFDPKTGAQKSRFRLENNSIASLSFSQDGGKLFAADSKTVYQFSVPTFSSDWNQPSDYSVDSAQIQTTEETISNIAAIPNGNRAAILLSNGQVVIQNFGGD